MADILIKIPDEIVSFVNINGFIPQKYIKDVSKALLESTPLPKGYGRLIDADALIEKAPEIQEYLDVLAPTIIEAETEAEDGNNN